MLDAPVPTVGGLALEAVQIDPLHLAIKNTAIDDEQGAGLTQTLQDHGVLFSRMTTLDVQSNHITASSIVAIGNMMVSLSLSSLRNVSLDNNALGDDGVELIVDAMLGLPHNAITSLSLQLNNISHVGAMAIARMLRHCACVQQLFLNGNELGDQGAAAIATAFVGDASPPLPPSKTLYTIPTTNLASASTTLSSSPTLTDSHRATSTSPAAAATATATATSGTSVIPLSGSLYQPTPRKRNVTLKLLSMGHNGIGDLGVSALAEALAHNHSLASLLLNGNAIGTNGALALATWLEHNRSLTCLNLHLTDICKNGLQALVQCLVLHNNSLTTVHVSKCDGSQESECDDIFSLAAANLRMHQLQLLRESPAFDTVTMRSVKHDSIWLPPPKANLVCDRLALSSCRTLSKLDLSACRLAEVPASIQYLKSALVHLDLSRNRIRSLPNWLTDMEVLRVLNVTSNPDLLLPPTQIQAEGCEAIIKFLREIKGGVEYKRLKLLILGHGGAGMCVSEQQRETKVCC
jgi:Leucine-rich repeat (LRR) protein